MKNMIIGLFVLVIVGFIGFKVGGIYKVRGDLRQRVQYHLDFVNETTIDSVTQDLTRDAEALGIRLFPEDITIVYENTERLSVAQKLVHGKIAKFQNKQIGISVSYHASLLGVRLRQNITESKIKKFGMQPTYQHGVIPE